MPGDVQDPLGELELRTQKSGATLERPTIDLPPPALDSETSPGKSPPPTPADSKISKGLPEPTTVGKYSLLEKLGMGGMGVVYKALDPDLRREIALKMIRAGTFAQATDVTRFLMESQALARLRHPNIIQIHDAGEEDGQPYFVMEYVAGGSLLANRQQYLKKPAAAVAILEKVARATAFLHQHQMLHRDLKPANILLDSQGEPYLSDFGLVKWLDSGEELTHSQQRLGTPAYMAPEQTGLVEHPLGPWTDVWALGTIIYEILTGRRPFLGNTKSLVRDICEREPPPPRQLNPDLDGGLESIVLKCLHKDPTRRFASAEELADELGRWLRKEPLSTRPSGKVARLQAACRRHPWRSTVVLALGLGSVAVALLVTAMDPDRPLRAIHQKIANGSPVTIVPTKGAPSWFRWVSEAGATSPDKDGFFTISAADQEVMLELMTDVPADAYQLRGKIRHHACSQAGCVGVFVCRASLSSPYGKTYFYHRLAFDDVNSRDARLIAGGKPLRQLSGNAVNWSMATGGNVGLPNPWRADFGVARIASFQPSYTQGKRWREIFIKITQEHVHMTFEGEETKSRSWKELREEFATSIDSVAEHDPARFAFAKTVSGPSVRGGLGLIVSRGIASFDQFVLEPLSPDSTKGD